MKYIKKKKKYIFFLRNIFTFKAIHLMYFAILDYKEYVQNNTKHRSGEINDWIFVEISRQKYRFTQWGYSVDVVVRVLLQLVIYWNNVCCNKQKQKYFTDNNRCSYIIIHWYETIFFQCTVI